MKTFKIHFKTRQICQGYKTFLLLVQILKCLSYSFFLGLAEEYPSQRQINSIKKSHNNNNNNNNYNGTIKQKKKQKNKKIKGGRKTQEKIRQHYIYNIICTIVISLIILCSIFPSFYFHFILFCFNRKTIDVYRKLLQSRGIRIV